MHIVLANRYYSPDTSATSQMVTDLAEYLANQGHRVEVIASRQRYEEAAAQLASTETINGVSVSRVWTSTFGRGHLAGRALDYLSFYLSFFFAVLASLHKGSVVVCCTDPPLLSVPASLACGIRRAHLVNWLQDLYPEVAIALGVVKPRSPFTRILLWLRDRSLRTAWRNVALGEVMQERVQHCGVTEGRTTIIHNWSITLPAPIIPDDASNPLRLEWGISGQFIVEYSGNLGKAHEIDTLLEAARILGTEANICFLMIGAGYYTEELRIRAKREGLGNIHFQPYQPLNNLHNSLAVANVHLVILRPEMEGSIVPSKFYGAAASGRPIIFVGSDRGEIARILQREQAGITVPSGDGRELAKSVLHLRDNTQLRQSMGVNARRITEEVYTRDNSLNQWSQLLSDNWP